MSNGKLAGLVFLATFLGILTSLALGERAADGALMPDVDLLAVESAPAAESLFAERLDSAFAAREADCKDFLAEFKTETDIIYKEFPYFGGDSVLIPKVAGALVVAEQITGPACAFMFPKALEGTPDRGVYDFAKKFVEGFRKELKPVFKRSGVPASTA